MTSENQRSHRAWFFRRRDHSTECFNAATVISQYYYLEM